MSLTIVILKIILLVLFYSIHYQSCIKLIKLRIKLSLTYNQAYGGKRIRQLQCLTSVHFPRQCRRESAKHDNDVDDFYIVRKRDNRHRFKFHEHRRSVGCGFHRHIAAWHHRRDSNGTDIFRSIRVLLILLFIFI